jgi:phospholipid transport system transporter-binding protein
MSHPTPIAPTGDLTIASAQAQRQVLLDALAGDAEALHLDLSQVEACDSAGVQLLLALRHSARTRGLRLTLSDASAPVRDALKTYGLDRSMLAGPGDTE